MLYRRELTKEKRMPPLDKTLEDQEEDLKDNIDDDSNQDESKDSERFLELNTKKDRTEEEDSELSEIKKNYGKKVQKRINQYKSKADQAAERAALAEERAVKVERDLEELKRSSTEKKRPSLEKETITVGEESYYTDRALKAMIDNGDIDEQQAFSHQQQRLKKEAAEEAYQRLRQETVKDEQKRVKQDDVRWVEENYPDLKNSDPVLYKEANRLYGNGYHANPKGLSEAIKDAERILGRSKNSKIDISDDLSVNSNSSSRPLPKRPGEMQPLSEGEIDIAYRMYVMGGMINPNTRKTYTKQEAVDKFKEAKRQRAVKS